MEGRKERKENKQTLGADGGIFKDDDRNKKTENVHYKHSEFIPITILPVF